MRGVAAVLAVLATLAVAAGQDSCINHEMCRDCIRDPNCQWCNSPYNTTVKGGDLAVSQEHCISKTRDLTDYCDPTDIENPSNSFTNEEDLPLTGEAGDNSHDKIIQLRPQRMKLQLRKGVTQNVTIRYKRAQDYPVDLYYLMDLSNSMSDDKDNLANLTSKLSDLLNSLTTQSTLGFGSFVDKVLMPFADTSPEKLEEPCKGCARPYSYKNHLSLASNNAANFKKTVEDARTSGNLDAPEGGFDALMQAMVCKEEIGWRDQATHILVFSTDAKFHHAGDGRLAGIIVPNDMQCHLEKSDENEKNHEYKVFDKYDYPSIAQINKVANENDIHLIFAVSGHGGLYEKLVQHIKNSKYGSLTQDSSNVIELVREQYYEISSTVALSDNSSLSPISLLYHSACLGNGKENQTNQCHDIKEGSQVTFRLEVTAEECPADGRPVVLEVKTLQDRVILEVEVQCSCSCENPDEVTLSSNDCSSQGDLVCGVCACHDGYRGGKCECSTSHSDNSQTDSTLCRAPGDNTTCSDQGYCSCGICVCRDKDVHGKFCQCNRRKCLSGTGEECSGRGSCNCNECSCHTGFQGDTCECHSDAYCKAPGSQDVCSGHGECRCGKCVCTTEQDFTYTGRYCEDCPTCNTGKCSKFRDCVECTHFGTGDLQGQECHSCNLTSTPVDVLTVTKNTSLCTFEDDEGCRFNFTYRYENRGSPTYLLEVQRERQCPEPPPVLGIVFGLTAGIVALGLLTLLLWKIATTIHDRREFAKFENERKNAQWNTEENPLYNSPATTFQNPVFAQKAS